MVIIKEEYCMERALVEVFCIASYELRALRFYEFATTLLRSSTKLQSTKFVMDVIV